MNLLGYDDPLMSVFISDLYRNRRSEPGIKTTLLVSVEALRVPSSSEVNCILSSSVEYTESRRGAPLIKVRTPVKVAEGIVGRRRPAVFVQLIAFFRGACSEIGATFLGDFFEFDETKKERNAANETSITATQASICCQKTSHVSSTKVPSCSPETRTRATTHMTKLKHRENPSNNFCRKRILTFHKRRTGIAMTSELNLLAGKLLRTDRVPLNSSDP